MLLESNGAKISELELKRAKLDYRSARFNHYPKLSGVAGLTQDDNSYSRDPGARYRVEDLFIGLQVSWNVYDGPNTKGMQLSGLTRIRQAERALDNLKDSLKQVAETEALSVNYAWEASRNASVRYRFAREGGRRRNRSTRRRPGPMPRNTPTATRSSLT